MIFFMKFIPFLILFLATSAHATKRKLDPLTFGKVTLAEERMMIDLKSLEIVNEGKFSLGTRFIPGTLQWIRMDEVLLIPRALLQITVKEPLPLNFYFEYENQHFIPLYDPTSGLYQTQIFISLFESLPVSLYEDGKKVNSLRIIPKKDTSKVKHLIDYSCAPYDVEVEGAEDDFLSVGCKIQRTGSFGEEKPYLEVYITSALYRLKDNSPPPYVVPFYKNGSGSIAVINHLQKEGRITVKARVPEKLPRLRFAAGLGPYNLESKSSGDKITQIAPTVMLYGNLTLNEKSSLRGFDSYSKNTSTFHNWGLYLAWDLASFCDQRCLFTSLLGVQGIDYQHNSSMHYAHEIIYPQGFEFEYRHAFGEPNAKLVYGMFASLSQGYDYENIWLRYGKKVFWEINYIEWGQDRNRATMYGLSVGFPLMSFF